jgi:geranylgeranyl diphosphate synthase type I
MQVFDTTRSEVIVGQFLDVSVQARGDSDVEPAMRVLRYKSAKYSIERPLHVGATLAGATPDVLESLTAVRPPARGGLPAARRPPGRVR